MHSSDGRVLGVVEQQRGMGLTQLEREDHKVVVGMGIVDLCDPVEQQGGGKAAIDHQHMYGQEPERPFPRVSLPPSLAVLHRLIFQCFPFYHLHCFLLLYCFLLLFVLRYDWHCQWGIVRKGRLWLELQVAVPPLGN